MSENHPHAISALSKLKATLLRRRAELSSEKRQVQADIASLDRVMQLLDPNCDTQAIKPVSRPQRRLFARGELAAHVLDVLKAAAEPMSVNDIAAAVGERSGITENIRDNVKDALKLQLKNGTVEIARRGKFGGHYWRIAGDGARPSASPCGRVEDHTSDSAIPPNHQAAEANRKAVITLRPRQ